MTNPQMLWSAGLFNAQSVMMARVVPSHSHCTWQIPNRNPHCRVNTEYTFTIHNDLHDSQLFPPTLIPGDVLPYEYPIWRHKTSMKGNPLPHR